MLYWCWCYSSNVTISRQISIHVPPPHCHPSQAPAGVPVHLPRHISPDLQRGGTWDKWRWRCIHLSDAPLPLCIPTPWPATEAWLHCWRSTQELHHQPAPAGAGIILMLDRGVSAAILNNKTQKAKYWIQKIWLRNATALDMQTWQTGHIRSSCTQHWHCSVGWSRI